MIGFFIAMLPILAIMFVSLWASFGDPVTAALFLIGGILISIACMAWIAFCANRWG